MKLAIGLAAAALAAAVTAAAAGDPNPPREPYSCRQYHEAERNCGAFGNCDAKILERLKRDCLRDGGRP